MSNNRTCRRCFYWRGDRAAREDREKGTCLANPPTVVVDPDDHMNRSMRAESSAGSVCKEWTHVKAFEPSWDGGM
jgi:hypothetical protein